MNSETMRSCTKRQLTVLEFMINRIRSTGIKPSYEEIGDNVGIVKSGVHRAIVGLESRGYVRRGAGSCRGIEILRYPPGYESAAIAESVKALMSGSSLKITKIGDDFIVRHLSLSGEIIGHCVDEDPAFAVAEAMKGAH